MYLRVLIALQLCCLCNVANTVQREVLELDDWLALHVLLAGTPGGGPLPHSWSSHCISVQVIIIAEQPHHSFEYLCPCIR